MKTAQIFTFLRFQQPSEAAWEEISALANSWNEKHEPRFCNTIDMLWSIRFPDREAPEFSEFRICLNALHERFAVNYESRTERVFSDDEHRSADFVEILGVGLGSADRPFILNEDGALGPPVPCPKCGYQDMFNRSQRAPFVIDESLLDEPLPEGGQPPKGGWDCVNLPNGHKLVSRRVVTLLESANVRGFELLAVHAGTVDQRSGRMYQILARKAMPVLHPAANFEKHLVLCPVCGTARFSDPYAGRERLEVQPEYHVKPEEVGPDEMFSRHPSRGAMLFVPGRVYATLVDGKLNGITASEIVRYEPRPTRKQEWDQR